MESILTHVNNPAGDSGSDVRGKDDGRSADSPPIDPDEEIDEDGAFNSEDELAYGDFFPPTATTATSSSPPPANVHGSGVVVATRMDGNGHSHGYGGTDALAHAIASSSSSSGLGHRADGLPTSRSRPTSIAMIDEVVALQHPHHQYQVGGGVGVGGGGGRNRIFSIDFDREFSFLSLPPPPSPPLFLCSFLRIVHCFLSCGSSSCLRA